MSQTYTKQEVAENNGKNGKPVWMIVKGSVYDVTKFMHQHPGGEELIMECAGRDATKEFNEAGHSADALSDMKKYKIGTVVAAAVTPQTTNTDTGKQKQQEAATTANGVADCYRTQQKKRIKLFFCF